MPVEWVTRRGEAPVTAGASRHARGDPPLACLHLWPHRSLPRRGFVLFFGASFALAFLPLVAVVGTPVLWGLAPFVLGTLGFAWAMVQKSYRDGEILEELSIWSDRVALVRRARGHTPQEWAANPYWVTLTLHGTGGPVPDYLTLKGAGREVELGAFLSADERAALHGTLRDVLARIAAGAGPMP